MPARKRNFEKVADRSAIRFASPPTGAAIDTRAFYCEPGDHEIDLTVRIDGTVETFGTLDVVDAMNDALLARAPLHGTGRLA